MKKIGMYSTILIVSTFLVGCATNDGQQQSASAAVESAIPFIRPGVAVVCGTVLQAATNGQDRIDKANIINSISAAVASLSSGSCPTADQVSSAIKSVAPSKAHWSSLATSIGGIYNTAFTQYIKGDAKLAADVLNQICLGCTDATQPYVGGQKND